MTEDERFAWLQLAFTPYIGAESFLLLLRRFGSASNALSAPATGRPGGAAQAGGRGLAQCGKTRFGAAGGRSGVGMGNAGRMPPDAASG